MIAPFLLISCSNPFQETKLSSSSIESWVPEEVKVETSTGHALSGAISSQSLPWIDITDKAHVLVSSWTSWYLLEDGKIITLGGLGDKVPVIWADVATFQIAPGTPYARDKNSLYLMGEVLTNFDRQTFEVLNWNYMKDKNGIYYFNYQNHRPFDFKYIAPLVGADLSSFHVFDLFFAKDKHNVYRGSKIFEWVDLVTFTTSEWFGHDKNAVYYTDGQKMGIISDPASFEVLTPKSWKGWRNICGYLKDKNNVYVFGDNGAHKILNGADADSFERLDPYYGKDQISVYLCANKINNADPATFIVQDGWWAKWAKDKNSVYDFWGKPVDIQDLDITSFEFVWSEYAKDKNNVYCTIYTYIDSTYRIIPWADPQTFQDLEEMRPYDNSNGSVDQTKVAKDKNHYYNGACQVAP